MSLKCGIVGLPNVGKSSLFSALSKQEATIANFPFCTINPQEGKVHVPDERLYQLAKVVDPEKITPTTISYVDIAGLVKGASKGEGLGNTFLSHIREVDVILHVVRCFESTEIIHVEGETDPLFDKKIIDTELQESDIATLNRREEKLAKLVKKGEKGAKEEVALLLKAKEHLIRGRNIRDMELAAIEKTTVDNWQLLTIKPVIYVANVDNDSLEKKNIHVKRLEELVEKEKAPLLMICAALEVEISEMDEKDQHDILSIYNISQSGLSQLIRASYNLLGLITYFTAGEKEVRAWTIQKGTHASQAASVIHTDLEEGFIKAEVIKMKDYLHYKSEQCCKEAGKISIEGKSYLVCDGDIIHFKTR